MMTRRDFVRGSGLGVAALAMPGVLAVLTGADAVADGLGSIPHTQISDSTVKRPPHVSLPADKARFAGEAVALVVAQTREQAKAESMLGSTPSGRLCAAKVASVTAMTEAQLPTAAQPSNTPVPTMLFVAGTTPTTRKAGKFTTFNFLAMARARMEF